MFFYCFGSNLGNRNLFLKQGYGTHVERELASPNVQTSPVYETQSWGKTDLPDYFNQVISAANYVLSAQQDVTQTNIRKLRQILERKREEKWGSRTIDIDILFYGDEIINDAESN